MNAKNAISLLMIKTLLIGLMALSMSSCAQSPVKVAKPATDLQILKLGVHALTEERHPTGEIQHPDEAVTNGQLLSVAIDLDNTNWLQNRDKARLRKFVDDSVAVIAESRAEVCSWFNLSCKKRRRASLEPFKPPE